MLENLHNAQKWLPTWLWELFTPTVAWLLSGLSVVIFVMSLFGAVAVAKWMPEDYFIRETPGIRERVREGGGRFLVWLALRQILGLGLLLAGLAMLVLPGQGLLTLLAALCVAEFPGKTALVRLLIRRRGLRRGLNALRRRAGRGPLRFPDEGSED